MPDENTVPYEVLKELPRRRFAELLEAFGSDRAVRRLSSWVQPADDGCGEAVSGPWCPGVPSEPDNMLKTKHTPVERTQA
jgi:hypothetical protein